MSTNDEHPPACSTDTPRPPRGWTELQRREGNAFLSWLSREQRLHKGFDALAIALRETFDAHVRTASDARAVWHAAPAVLEKCDKPTTYTMRQAEIAYAWLHLLDRYVRTWLALEHVLKSSLLPMGRYGVRVLDVGTGPGPSAFATHDFYAAMEEYARTADAPSWRQPPDITCVEPALTMNHIRHDIAERLTVNGAPRSVLAMTRGIHDFCTILPAQARREIENNLRNELEEYYDEQRAESHAYATYTAEEANREANAYHRYRLFTFSNFLTTPGTVSSFRKNIEGILADAHAGSVLLMIGATGGCYPAIQERMAALAAAGGFRHRNDAVTVASADARLDRRLDKEVRWFYRRLKQLAGDLPTNEPCATELREELEHDQPVSFRSSIVHAFRK